MKLSVELTDEMVEAVAERVVKLLAEREPARAEAYLDVDGAATFLACPRSRIYALVSARRIPHERDGSRLLFRPDELRDWVGRGGAVRP